MSAAPASVEAFNPYPHLEAAASGDLEALRLLTREGMNAATRDRDIGSLFEALVFARLAHARSGSIEDVSVLLGYLAYGQHLAEEIGDLPLIASLQSEFIAHASILADEGQELAAHMLPALVAESLPEAVAAATGVRELMMKGA